MLMYVPMWDEILCVLWCVCYVWCVLCTSREGCVCLCEYLGSDFRLPGKSDLALSTHIGATVRCLRELQLCPFIGCPLVPQGCDLQAARLQSQQGDPSPPPALLTLLPFWPSCWAPWRGQGGSVEASGQEAPVNLGESFPAAPKRG